MVVFPKKRIFGLVGAPRSGKDTVANFLQETRNFAPMAFADKIKEEFGISKEDFEAAKIAGNIEALRNSLWEFSASKKAINPLYFIEKVMDTAVKSKDSCVITDIRTMDEVNAFFNYGESNCLRRIYFVDNTAYGFKDDNGFIKGTQIEADWMEVSTWDEDSKFTMLLNSANGLYEFLCSLDNFFFKEDIMDLPTAGENDFQWRSLVSDYVSQFNVRRAI